MEVADLGDFAERLARAGGGLAAMISRLDRDVGRSSTG